MVELGLRVSRSERHLIGYDSLIRYNKGVLIGHLCYREDLYRYYSV
jgi:hypothetical protein